MIKKLERKIQWTIFLILTVTTLGIFLTINVTNYQSLVAQERTFLQRLGTYTKKAPDNLQPKSLSAENAAPEPDPTLPQIDMMEPDPGLPQIDMAEPDPSLPRIDMAEPDPSLPQINMAESNSMLPQIDVMESDPSLPQIDMLEPKPDSALTAEPEAETSDVQDLSKTSNAQDQKKGDETLHEFYNSYIVQISADGTVTVTAYENAAYTEEEITAIAQELLASGEQEGMYKDLRFLVKTLPDKKEIVFLKSLAQSRFLASFVRSLTLCLFLMVLFFLAARILSRRIVLPVRDAFNKQKQFISDASHELKTPITVINANIDLLRTEIGENKWMDYIEAEGQRMTALITNLLTLSRISSEESTVGDSAHFCEFDLSSALLGTALSFESLAFEHGISYDVAIAEDLCCTGCETEIRQLAAILLDNAMKYTSPNGSVRITLQSCTVSEGRSLTLRRRPRRIALLEVSNTGAEIPNEELEKIFDRFYRTDKSRNRASGGFGLGLAIAKSIAEKHGGEILVESRGGWTTFSARIPL